MDGFSTRDAYERSMVNLAADTFENHVVIESGQGRWVIARAGLSPVDCVEIVVMRWNHVVVHGAVDTAVLHGERVRADETDEGVLRYLANASRSKFTLALAAGMGMPTFHTDPDVAAGELLRVAADRIEENVCDWPRDETGLDEDAPDYEHDVEAFTFLSFLDRLTAELDGCDKSVAHLYTAASALSDRDDTIPQARDYLVERGWDAASFRDLGEVPIPRVFYVQAAVRQLVALWDAEKEARACARRKEIGHEKR